MFLTPQSKKNNLFVTNSIKLLYDSWLIMMIFIYMFMDYDWIETVFSVYYNVMDNWWR